jgi:hypothetical protein
MKKLLHVFLSAGFLAASLSMISAPATALAATQTVNQPAAAKSQSKNKIKKTKHATKSKKSKKATHKKSAHTAPKQ